MASTNPLPPNMRLIENLFPKIDWKSEDGLIVSQNLTPEDLKTHEKGIETLNKDYNISIMVVQEGGLNKFMLKPSAVNTMKKSEFQATAVQGVQEITQRTKPSEGEIKAINSKLIWESDSGYLRISPYCTREVKDQVEQELSKRYPGVKLLSVPRDDKFLLAIPLDQIRKPTEEDQKKEAEIKQEKGIEVQQPRPPQTTLEPDNPRHHTLEHLLEF